MIGTGSLSDLLRDENDLHSMLEKARTYGIDSLQELGIWLEWYTSGESAKRSLIQSGTFQTKQPAGFRGSFLNGGLFGNLALTRSPFWENITAETVATSSDITVNGETWDLSAESAYSGNFPGRIAKVYFEPTSTQTFRTIWAGIRDYRKGIADFDPVFAFTSGTGMVDTSWTTDANAIGGYALECDFSTTTTEDYRAFQSLGTLFSGDDHTHWIGSYTVLGRMRCDSATTAWVRCGEGYNLPIRFGPRVLVTASTYYRLYELGVVSFPPGGPYRYDTDDHVDLSDWLLGLYAERLSGSGSLWMDQLILIPRDHFIKVDSGSQINSSQGYVYTAPEGRQWAGLVQATEPTNSEFTPHEWNFPISPGVFTMAGEAYQTGALAHWSTNTMAVEIEYFPRWRLYRQT